MIPPAFTRNWYQIRLTPDAARSSRTICWPLLTAFGLDQPGAEIALKVFVVLTTNNEAGRAAMQIERTLAQVA